MLRGGASTLDPRLDRVPLYDPRSMDYRIRDVVAAGAPLVTRSWRVPLNLDQGREGACVGFGFNHDLCADPVFVRGCSNTRARNDYYDIQREDPWAGGAYPGASPFYEGTSVLTGAMHFKNAGFYTGVYWAKTEEEIAAAVSHVGPVVIGVHWWKGMMNPDANGYLRLSGGVIGGHCTLLHGIDVEGGFYWVWNSWGKDWGLGGRAKLKRADIGALLRTEGEACLPVRSARTTR